MDHSISLDVEVIHSWHNNGKGLKTHDINVHVVLLKCSISLKGGFDREGWTKVKGKRGSLMVFML